MNEDPKSLEDEVIEQAWRRIRTSLTGSHAEAMEAIGRMSDLVVALSMRGHRPDRGEMEFIAEIGRALHGTGSPP